MPWQHLQVTHRCGHLAKVRLPGSVGGLKKAAAWIEATTRDCPECRKARRETAQPEAEEVERG